MAVTRGVNVKIMPIFREPNEALKRLVIARWLGYVSGTGDNSGGSASVGLTIPNIYGGFALFDIHHLAWLNAHVSTSLILQIQTYEYCADGYMNPYQFPTTGVAASRAVDIPAQAFKFRMSENPATYSSINLTSDVNTNLATLQLWAAGYIYDERYLP